MVAHYPNDGTSGSTGPDKLKLSSSVIDEIVAEHLAGHDGAVRVVSYVVSGIAIAK